MPELIHKSITADCSYLVWDITENEHELLDMATLSEADLNVLETITHPRRRLENLGIKAAVTALAAHMNLPYRGLYKDEFGKPHPVEQGYHLSVSHDFPYAGVTIHRSLPTGIDLEKPREKLRRISQRFLSPEELKDARNSLERLCIYWSAKEALYKLHGRKKLIFRENIHVDSFQEMPGTDFRGHIRINDESSTYLLHIERIHGYWMCYVVSAMK